MAVDVRARILWGDPIESIREACLKKGASPALVDAALREGLRERNRHFRFRGLQDIGLSLLCFLVGAGAYWEIRISGRGPAVVLIASVAGPLAGLWLGIRGIRRIATGGASEKAASDLSEFE